MWEIHNYMDIKQYIPKQPICQRRKKERRKYLERNENEKVTYQNVCDLAKALL